MAKYQIIQNPFTGRLQYVLNEDMFDWQDSVLDKDLTAPPGSPTTGDRYIVASVATGAWAGEEKAIAEYNGGSWDFATPNEGFCVRVEDENLIYMYDGTTWANIGSAVDHGSLIGLGDDDHIQYLLADGTRPMAGNLDLGEFDLENVADIFGTTGSGDRGYVRIGDAGTTQHSLDSEDDLLVSGELEVKGNSWIDGNLDVEDQINFANIGGVILYVAPGGTYTTISAAMAVCTGGEIIVVAPGTYTETISVTGNYITIRGEGNHENVIIQQADANVIDAGANIGIDIVGVTLQVTAATTAINTVQVSTGNLHLIDCEVKMTCATAIVAVTQPACGAVTGTGTLMLDDTCFEYAHTGACGGTAQKGAFKVANGGLVSLYGCPSSTITNSGTALVSTVGVDTASTGIFQISDCVIDVTDPNATNVAGLVYVAGTGITHEFYKNNIHVNATANTGFGFYAADTATISRFFYNHIHVTDSGGTSYSFLIGTGATVISHFDDIIAADGTAGAGTFTEVSSFADGSLTLTDTLTPGSITMVNNVTEFSTDGTLGDDSDTAVPTEKAVKTYVDNAVAAEDFWDRAGGVLTPHNMGDDVDLNGQNLIDVGIIYGGTGSGGIAYLRVGDAGTTAHSLNSEDDLMVTGELEVKSNFYVDGTATIGTLTGMLKAATGVVAAAIADTDYQQVVTWGDGLEYAAGTAAVDFNTTNLKITASELNTIQDIDATATPSFAGLTLTGGATLTGDVISGIADLIGTSGSGDRGYIRIGDVATTAHSLDANDDLMVTGELEVSGAAWVDNTLTITGVVLVGSASTFAESAVPKLEVKGGGVANQVAEATASATDEVLSTGITSGYGLLVVTCTTDNVCGVYRIEHQTIVAISQNALFTITKDNASTYNVYWDTDQYKVQNRVAGSGETKNITVALYGT